jgi:ferredoxin-NADP reductase
MSIFTARVLNAWAPSFTTRAIRVEKPPEISFAASQATRLILGVDLARPMTIASGPARPHLDFAVQHTDSKFKRAFFALTCGTTVQVTAPRGHFLLERARPAVMIAADIGVTPFRSMLGALADEHATLAGALVHATGSPRDVPFHDEIETLARRAGLRLSHKNGPVDEDQLRTLAADIGTPVWYIAGPMEDVQHVRDLLGSIGIDREDIRLETFRYAGSLAAPSLSVGTPDREAGGS